MRATDIMPSWLRGQFLWWSQLRPCVVIMLGYRDITLKVSIFIGQSRWPYKRDALYFPMSATASKHRLSLIASTWFYKCLMQADSMIIHSLSCIQLKERQFLTDRWMVLKETRDVVTVRKSRLFLKEGRESSLASDSVLITEYGRGRTV